MKTNHGSCVSHASRGRRAHARDGAVLLVVMLTAGAMLLAVTAMVLMAGNATFRMRRLTSDAKALNIAEAGIADMIGKLTTNYWHWRDSTNAADFGDGSFRVVSRTVLPSSNVLITSVGSAGGVSRTTVVELLGNERDRNDMLFSLDGAILSGGDVRFRTAAFTIRGNVHSNADITSSSGAHNGDFEPAAGATDVYISAAGSIGDLQGTHQPGVEGRELPEFNFDGYRQLALADQSSPVSYIEGDLDERHWNPVVPTGG